jgi:hypothetical protein
VPSAAFGLPLARDEAARLGFLGSPRALGGGEPVGAAGRFARDAVFTVCGRDKGAEQADELRPVCRFEQAQQPHVHRYRALMDLREQGLSRGGDPQQVATMVIGIARPLNEAAADHSLDDVGGRRAVERHRLTERSLVGVGRTLQRDEDEDLR